MKRIAIRVVPAVALLVLGLAWFMPRVSGQGGAMPSTKNGEWPMYTADLRGSKYSPLDQVNASNFSKMEVAWRFKTDNLGPRPETKLGATPLMVEGHGLRRRPARAGLSWRSMRARASRSGSTAWTRASAPRGGRRASSQAAVSPIGPTARATIA